MRRRLVSISREMGGNEMSLDILCPKNKDHKKFSTTAHVCEEWLVDEHRNFLSTMSCLQVTHGPDPDNIFYCVGCDKQAIVKVAKE